MHELWDLSVSDTSLTLAIYDIGLQYAKHQRFHSFYNNIFTLKILMKNPYM